MKLKSAFWMMSAVLLLSGCGLKGPLYIPPEKAKTPDKVKLEQTKDPQREILGRTEKSAPAAKAGAAADKSANGPKDEKFSSSAKKQDASGNGKADSVISGSSDSSSGKQR